MQLQKVVCYKVLVGLHDISWYIFHDKYNKVVSCSLGLTLLFDFTERNIWPFMVYTQRMLAILSQYRES